MESTTATPTPTYPPVETRTLEELYTDLTKLIAVITEHGSSILARSGRNSETKHLELVISVEHESDREHTMTVGFAPPKPVERIPVPGPGELLHLGKSALQSFGIDPETI